MLHDDESLFDALIVERGWTTIMVVIFAMACGYGVCQVIIQLLTNVAASVANLK